MPIGANAAALTGSPEPIALELVSADGQSAGLPQSRGTLVFVFASFDGMSQAALDVLRRFAQRHPDRAIIGVLHEPSARHVLAPFLAAADVPFETYWERSGILVTGSQAFRPVTSVPTFLLLNEAGQETARHEGFMQLGALEAFVP